MLHVLTSPWIALLVLVAVGLLLRCVQGSSFSPSVFPALLWSIYLAVPMAVTPYPVAGVAAWVIVALVAAATVGALAGEGISSERASNVRVLPPQVANRLLRLCVVFSVVATIGAVYHGVSSMARFSLPWTSEGLLQLSVLLYGMTYEENEPILVRLLVMWAYPAAVLGGMCFGLSTRRSARICAFSPFVPSVLYALIVAARTGLMVATVCWAAGFLSIQVYQRFGQFHFRRRSAIALVLLAALLIGVFLGLDLIRGKEYETTSVVSRVQGSVLGYVSVFSSWITTDHYQELGLGAFTIAGVFDLLRIKTRLHGLYSEVLSFEAGEDSNIYSAFRGLIQDFTFPGALLVSAVCGFIAGVAYRRAAAGGLCWVVLVGVYYAFFFWSPIVSLFNYNGVILAFLVAFWALASLQNSEQSALARQVIPSGGIRGPELIR